MTRWTTARDRVLALRRPSREREVVSQAAKAALAAAVALLITGWAAGSQAFLAPYAAVLAVTSTVRGSWTGAARQAMMVVAGVLLAFGVGTAFPTPAVALPAVVLTALLLGRWHVFGPEGWWVAVTALIVLVNGTAEHAVDLARWVALSLCGSLTGALVNTLLLPPVHLRSASDAVTALTREVAAQLREVGGHVRMGWSAPDAEQWARSARDLRAAVRRAADAVWHGRESMRWNPRRRLIRRVDSPLAGQDVVERLGRVSERALQVSVLLIHLAGPDGHPGDDALADLIDRLADAVDVLAEHPDDPAAGLPDTGTDPATDPGGEALRGVCVLTVSDALTELGVSAAQRAG
jgi:plasmid stabilization system protein ParE